MDTIQVAKEYATQRNYTSISRIMRDDKRVHYTQASTIIQAMQDDGFIEKNWSKTNPGFDVIKVEGNA